MKILVVVLGLLKTLFSPSTKTNMAVGATSDIGAVANAVGEVASVTGKIIDQKNKPEVLANIEAKQIAKMEEEINKAIEKKDINEIRKQVAE